MYVLLTNKHVRWPAFSSNYSNAHSGVKT